MWIMSTWNLAGPNWDGSIKYTGLQTLGKKKVECLSNIHIGYTFKYFGYRLFLKNVIAKKKF